MFRDQCVAARSGQLTAEAYKSLMDSLTPSGPKHVVPNSVTPQSAASMGLGYSKKG